MHPEGRNQKYSLYPPGNWRQRTEIISNYIHIHIDILQHNLTLHRHCHCRGRQLYFKDVVTLSGSHKDIGWNGALKQL